MCVSVFEWMEIAWSLEVSGFRVSPRGSHAYTYLYFHLLCRIHLLFNFSWPLVARVCMCTHSFHAYGANFHLPFSSLPFSISVIKCISINIAWGNELDLKLDHVKVRVPDSQWLPPHCGNCAAILAVITQAWDRLISAVMCYFHRGKILSFTIITCMHY